MIMKRRLSVKGDLLFIKKDVTKAGGEWTVLKCGISVALFVVC